MHLYRTATCVPRHPRHITKKLISVHLSTAVRPSFERADMADTGTPETERAPMPGLALARFALLRFKLRVGSHCLALISDHDDAIRFHIILFSFVIFITSFFCNSTTDTYIVLFRQPRANFTRWAPGARALRTYSTAAEGAPNKKRAVGIKFNINQKKE